MSPEHIRVVLVVYISALLPLLLVYLLRRRQVIPGWVPGVYVICLLLCALGWELWFTYGWVAGDPVDIRRDAVLNRMLPMHINWLMNSLADAGSVCLFGLWLMWQAAGRDSRVFEQWQWWPFLVLFVWCISQNIFVEMFNRPGNGNPPNHLIRIGKTQTFKGNFNLNDIALFEFSTF